MSELSKYLEKNESYQKVKLLNGKSIQIKPWNVGQENKALFAIDMDPDNRENIVTQCINLIRQCVDKPEEFDKLSRNALLDLTAKIRKLSKGTNIDVAFECENPKCPMNSGKMDRIPIEDTINIDECIKATAFDETLINIDKFGFKLNEVSFETQKKLELECLDKKIEIRKFNHELLKQSIVEIVIVDKEITDFDHNEIETLLNLLSTKDYQLLMKKFVKAMSTFKIEKKVKCPHCDDENDLSYDNIYSLLVF